MLFDLGTIIELAADKNALASRTLKNGVVKFKDNIDLATYMAQQCKAYEDSKKEQYIRQGGNHSRKAGTTHYGGNHAKRKEPTAKNKAMSSQHAYKL